MFEPKTLEEVRERTDAWAQQFNSVKQKFLKDKEYQATSAAGIPLKPVYTPDDVAHIAFSEIGMPGQFPFERGNYPMGYQFMPCANQPVIGCGTPEETRARMDYLLEQVITGYF